MKRVVPLLVCVVATFAFALAQPKKGAPAPAKGSGSAAKGSAAPAAGSGSGSGSAAAPPVEEGPPPDMEGKDENPGAPKIPGQEEKKPDKIPEKKDEKQTGYPTQEVLRPITLPANMAEVSIGPHASVSFDDGVGYAGSDSLRARYGITRQIQLGLTYTFAGIYHDPNSGGDLKFKSGKALGLDATYLLTDFIGVKLGVPVWIYKSDKGSGAPAIGLQLGVPLKFRFFGKLAIGGLDDLLSIRLAHFAPSFEYEYLNAGRAFAGNMNTKLSRGFLRFSGFVAYQKDPKLALLGRVGITFEDFSSDKIGDSGSTTFIRAGVEYTVKKYLDVGITLGFEDLSDAGSFGPWALLAFRI
jgi:hypothetical protein